MLAERPGVYAVAAVRLFADGEGLGQIRARHGLDHYNVAGPAEVKINGRRLAQLTIAKCVHPDHVLTADGHVQMPLRRQLRPAAKLIKISIHKTLHDKKYKTT